MPSPDLTASNLRLTDLLDVVRRRWPVVVGTTVVITSLLLVYSFAATKRYTATARILERTVASETAGQYDPNAGVPLYADRQVTNAVDQITSTEMREAVAKEYDGPIDLRTVKAIPEGQGSDAIDIAVTASSAREAARLANLYAKTYISETTKDRASALRKGARAIEKAIADLDDERDRINEALTEASASGSARTDSLVERLSTLDIQRSGYAQRLQGLQLSAGLADLRSAQLTDKATPPARPVSPKPLRNGVIGIMLGLGLGLAIAFAREFLDDSVRTSSDLDELTDATVPTLGLVPRFADSSSKIATVAEPASLQAEAFRAVRTAVRFVALDRAMKVIQITSAGAGEGKTTVVANLAAAFAQAGHRVAVVSCDLRRPDLHLRFDGPPDPGLTDVLLGECLLSEAMQRTDSGVYLLPSGSRPPNPSELLGSSRMKAVIEFLVGEFDFVLLDSTPILPVTDAVVVSQFAQATLVVVAARETHRQRVREGLDALVRAGAPLAGLILNKTDPRDEGAYDDTFDEHKKRARPSRVAGIARQRVRTHA